MAAVDRELLARINHEHVVLGALLSNYAYDPRQQTLQELRLALEVLGLKVKPIQCTEKYCVVVASSGDVYLAFRGTACKTDVWADIALGTYADAAESFQMHAGMRYHAETLDDYDTAEQKVVALLSGKTDNNIIFVGHSLGGAVAQLKYVDLLRQLRRNRHLVHCYTFGAPLFADWRWRLYCEKRLYHRNCFNLVDEHDIVPPMSTVHGFYSFVSQKLFPNAYLGNRRKFTLPEPTTAFPVASNTVVKYQYMGSLIVFAAGASGVKHCTQNPENGQKLLHPVKSLNAHRMSNYLVDVNRVFHITNPSLLPRSNEEAAYLQDAAAAAARRSKEQQQQQRQASSGHSGSNGSCQTSHNDRSRVASSAPRESLPPTAQQVRVKLEATGLSSDDIDVVLPRLLEEERREYYARINSRKDCHSSVRVQRSAAADTDSDESTVSAETVVLPSRSVGATTGQSRPPPSGAPLPSDNDSPKRTDKYKFGDVTKKVLGFFSS